MIGLAMLDVRLLTHTEQVDLVRRGRRGSAALQRIQPPDAVTCPEKHITEDRGKQRNPSPDAGPLPRLQAAREQSCSERSRQVHPPTEPHSSRGEGTAPHEHSCRAASALWAIALLGVLSATLIQSELGATALLAGVATVFAIGECVHGVVLGPLVADLAPPHLLGRYMSMYALMATAGLALGPAIGGVVLAISPDAVWWGGALVAAVIGAGFLLSGDRIPEPLAVEAGVPDVGEGPRAATRAPN